jgi:hypothetical protein
MSTENPIRTAVGEVMAMRQRHAADAALGAAVRAIKRVQAQRFTHTYADLLRDERFGPPAQFFLTELYGDKDYTDRDQQFARIAGPLERIFPADVVATAETLAELHRLSEHLDDRMAEAWRALEPLRLDAAARYLRAWRNVGERDQRQLQLHSVLELGHELADLTAMAGLRSLLRTMRLPARLAGLSALQAFLEAGFDTFAVLSRSPGAVPRFLATIAERENAWIAQLFDEAEACLLPQLRAALQQPIPTPAER